MELVRAGKLPPEEFLKEANKIRDPEYIHPSDENYNPELEQLKRMYHNFEDFNNPECVIIESGIDNSLNNYINSKKSDVCTW